MPRRHWALAVTVVVLASAISAAVAYRFGARKEAAHSAGPATTPQAAPARAFSDAAASVPSQACVPFAEAAPLVGNTACVTGRVLKVATSKAGHTFLDFCEDYRKCPFSTVIFFEDRAKFGDLLYLQGQVVELRGLVGYYRERPQIIIRDPGQLKLRE